MDAHWKIATVRIIFAGIVCLALIFGEIKQNKLLWKQKTKGKSKLE